MMSADINNTQVLKVLRDAGLYFHAHSGSKIVLYLDSKSFLQKESRFRQLFDDLSLLCSLNVKFIIVFSPFLVEEKIKLETQAALAESIDEISINKIYIERLLSQSFHKYLRSSSIISGHFVVAKPLGIIEGEDFGFYGKIRAVDSQALIQLLESQSVVIVPPFAYSPNGECFILNGIEVAEEIAVKIRAEKLIVLSQFDSKLPREMSLMEAKELYHQLDEKQVNSSERFFLKHAAASVERGVERVHLLEIETSGCLLLELLTRDGIGSMVTNQSYDLLRSATIEDVPLLAGLIRPFEEEGVLIHRSISELERDINHFSLMFRDGALIGSVAFYAYPEDNMGELACLVIHADYRQGKKAYALLKHVEMLAKKAGLSKVFLLTTQTAHWFIENGFAEASISDLPAIKQANYNAERRSSIFIKNLMDANSY